MEEILKILYKETQELKNSIELIELMSGQESSGKGLLLEHLVKKFVNVKVKMYQEHHNLPHVHIDIGRRNHTSEIWQDKLFIFGGNTTPFISSCLASTQNADLSALLNTAPLNSLSELKVYPNPVNTSFNLSLFNQIIDSVTIYNTFGQVVLKKTLNLNEGTLDVADLPAGTYLVKVTSNETVKTIKIIKE